MLRIYLRNILFANSFAKIVSPRTSLRIGGKKTSKLRTSSSYVKRVEVSGVFRKSDDSEEKNKQVISEETTKTLLLPPDDTFSINKYINTKKNFTVT